MNVTTTKKLTKLQIGRLVLYGFAVIIGLVAVIAEAVGATAVAQVLEPIGTTLLLVTGGTAALNINRGEKKVNVDDVLVALTGVVAALENVKDRADEAAEVITPRAAEEEEPTPSVISLDELRKASEV